MVQLQNKSGGSNYPYMIFIDAADDAAMYPANKLLSVTCAANATVLMNFASSVAGGGGLADEHDIITLTITADKEREVMQDIATALAGPDPYIIICDDVNSIRMTNVSSCTITLDT